MKERRVPIDDLEGRLIDGRYELLERIGEGAMGVVYRAHQQIVDREVAVKFLHSEIAADEDFRARFEREAKALGKLDHPGCVRVLDFGWHSELDAPFLVTDFIHGEPLFEILGQLSVDEIVLAAEQIARAMAHAHAHSVVHRDLKPENILVGGDDISEGNLKIVDFGLARLSSEDEIRLTKTGEAHGTPAYMSPEQCQGEEQIGPPADVYGLGCILYEFLEGQLPFTASTPSGVLIKHVTKPTPRVSRLDVDPGLVDLVEEMMNKAAFERPSMEEVAARLQAIRSTDGTETAIRLEPAPTASEDDNAPPPPSGESAESGESGESGEPDVSQRPEMQTALESGGLVMPRSRARLVVGAVAALLVLAGAATMWTLAAIDPAAELVDEPKSEEPEIARVDPPEPVTPDQPSGEVVRVPGVEEDPAAEPTRDVEEEPSERDADAATEEPKGAPRPTSDDEGETEERKTQNPKPVEAAEEDPPERDSVKLKY